MKRTALLLMIVMAVLAGCAGGAEDSGGDSGDAPREEAAAEDAAVRGGEGDGDGAQEAEPAGGEEGSGDGLDIAAAVSQTAAIGDRVVRNGTMRLRVDDDTFDAAFERLVGLADRFGGTVLASDATNTGDGSTSGTVTLRVPAEDFDELLVAVGRIGEVERRSITSEDVSDEFVDLEARLRHNQAQEAFYLSLLDRADDVEDAIAVQQRVEGIQQTIEQIQGRLRFLKERTSFSRLTVELFEAGGAFASADAQPSLARYWATARAALVNVLGGALVVATVALPFVLLGALIFVLVRRTSLLARPPTASEAEPAA
ncbi:MAG: DUF4349 domain-containing protein [Actinobacteria bacterium]|nr:DUF4349 domain-containing protein [Actinomycetota bacterium]